MGQNSSRWKKGNVPWIQGKKHSLETKEKISKARKGKNKGDKNASKRPEVRKKISEANKGKKNGMYGKHSWNYIDGRGYSKSPMRYGDDWNDIRQLIYKRDGYICQKCKKHKPLDVHHIIPFMQSFDNSLNNLISLCRSCHMKEEMKLVKEKMEEI